MGNHNPPIRKNFKQYIPSRNCGVNICCQIVAQADIWWRLMGAGAFVGIWVGKKVLKLSSAKFCYTGDSQMHLQHLEDDLISNHLYWLSKEREIELRNNNVQNLWRWSPQYKWITALFISDNERRLKRIWNDQPLHITWWEITSVNISKQIKLWWPKISILLSIR